MTSTDSPDPAAHAADAADAADAPVGSSSRAIGPILRRLVSPPPDASWSLARTFTVVFPLIALGMLFLGRTYYFGSPLFESGDLAANSLQIELAKHLQEIYGNYSRFGFHHPGPAFFYVYAAGELLFFDVLHLVPAEHNGQLLAGALLQAAFLATLISVVARFATPNRRLFIAVAIAIALIHFQLSGNPEFSVWPPEQLVFPFACFLVVAIALACGWTGLLPVLVVCGGFLVHGHVAQPLFVLPTAALAYVIGFWRVHSDAGLSVPEFIRRNLKSHVLAVVVFGIFAAPLARDAIHWHSSNISTILATLTAPRVAADIHSPTQILAYLLAFLGFPAELSVLDFSQSDPGTFIATYWAGIAASVLVLIVAPVALWLTRPRGGSPTAADPDVQASGRRFLTTFYAFVLFFVLLTLAWIYMQKGPLFEFNSYFIYGLMYVAILPSALVACRRWPVSSERMATIFVGLLAVVVATSATIPVPQGEELGAVTLDPAVQRLVAHRSPSAPPVLLEFPSDEWDQALGIALTLERSNVTWYVEPGYGLRFGTKHEYVAQAGAVPPEKWVLVPPAAGQDGQIDLGDGIAIYPRPPSLASVSAAP